MSAPENKVGGESVLADVRPAAEERVCIECDVHCAQCGYNLRGLSEARCPECGCQFDFEDARRGAARANIPTPLDRADPWQPHQLLLRSLAVLADSMRRPARLVRTLDLRGPPVPAVFMLVLGVAWIYFAAGLFIAVGTAIHTGCSPYMGLKNGFLVWSPVLTLIFIPATFASLAPLWRASVVGVVKPTRSQRFRLACYWAPAQLACFALPTAVVLAIQPEFAGAVLYLGALFGLWPSLRLFLMCIRRTDRARSDRVLLIWWPMMVFCACADAWAMQAAIPSTIEPPLWLYHT